MFKTESYKKGVFYSTGLNIIARSIGFLNTLIIAFYFGANITTDIYFLVLSVGVILTGIINGMDLLVLIPEAMRLRIRESEEASRRFLNFFFYAYLLIGILVASFVVISPVLFYSFFSKFDASDLYQNDKILYAGSAIILFQLLNNFMGSILSSYKYFTISIFTNLINSVFAILVTVFFHDRLGIAGTISGIALGYAINFILLVSVLKKFQNWDFLQVTWMKSKAVWMNIGLMQANILPIWIRNSIGLYLLSGLDKGVITALNLGLQITAIPEILVINQLLAVSGIKFNELHAQQNNVEANNTFLLMAKIGLAVTTLLGSAFFLLSDEVIAVIFSKSALSEETLKNASIVFGFMIFCLPTKFLSLLSTNVLTAFQKIKETVAVSFGIHCCVTVAFVLLVKYFGLLGYLIGINIHFYLFFILFWPIFKSKLSFIKYKKVFIYFCRDLLLNAIACLLTYLICQILFPLVESNIVQLIIGLAVYCGFIISINEVFSINQILKIKKYKKYVFQRFFS